MTNEKLLQFNKRWRALEGQRKNYDFNFSEFCRDLRAEFAGTVAGEKAFAACLADDFGVSAIHAQEMSLRAVAAKLVGDAQAWDRLGGFRGIGVHGMAMLPRAEQVAVIEAAKASNKAVRTIMRERGHAPEVRKSTGPSDVEIVARFVAELPNAPRAVKEAAARLLPAAPRAKKPSHLKAA